MGRTWDYLEELGFVSEAEQAGWNPKCSLDLGTFVLAASDTMNRYFRQVVAFYGNYVTERAIGEVEFELPEYLASKEQCAAMIFYYLRNHDISFEPDWFEEARGNSSLLPWEMDWQKERDRKARLPRCDVGKDWLRLAIREMRAVMDLGLEESVFTIEFNGSVLTIRHGDKVIAVAGTGSPWSNRYELSFQTAASLPKRLTNGNLCIDHENLWISGRRVGKVREVGIER